MNLLRKIFYPKNKIKPRVDFFIVGAQKAGTTALYRYLLKHPKIFGAKGKYKETGFFNHDALYQKGISFYHSRFFPVSVFNKKKKTLFVESSPGYMQNRKAAERIFKYNPEAKIIILLRDPIKRAYSAWNMYNQFRNSDPRMIRQLYNHHLKDADEKIRESWKEFMEGEEEVSLCTYIKKEIESNFSISPSILSHGLYFQSITNFLKYFNQNQILILQSEKMKREKEKYLKETLDFIGVDAFNWGELKDEHVRKYENSIDPEAVDLLREFYFESNEKLFKLTGINYNAYE